MRYEDSEHLKKIRPTRKCVDELKEDLFWIDRDLRKIDKEVSNHHEDIIQIKHSIEMIEYRLRRLEET